MVAKETIEEFVNYTLSADGSRRWSRQAFGHVRIEALRQSQCWVETIHRLLTIYGIAALIRSTSTVSANEIGAVVRSRDHKGGYLLALVQR